jgi:hypothetical protein
LRGTGALATVAAVYNFYFCLNAQGRLRREEIPRQFSEALPQIRELSDYMMKRKRVLVFVVAAKEIIEELKQIL